METNNFCIANTRGNGCSKLSVEKCMGESCSFAQTREEAEASSKKVFERLNVLGKVIQIYISNKYYGGKMPWVNSDDASVEEAANNILNKHLKAFE